MIDAIDVAVRQCPHHIGTATRLLRGVTDSHRALEPMPGTKTAGWLIGHLCVTGDYGRKLCGRAPMCPKEWRGKFNPGTHPSHDASEYPPMVELVQTFERIYVDLIEAAAGLGTDAQNAPNPFTPAATEMPTAGEFVAYLMTAHLSWHLGQLYAWRAAAAVK